MQNFVKRIILFSLLLIFIKAENYPEYNINCNLFNQKKEIIVKRLNDFVDSIFELLNNCEKQGNLNCYYKLYNFLSINLNELLNQSDIKQLTRALYEFYYRNPLNIRNFKIFIIKILTRFLLKCFSFRKKSFCAYIMEIIGLDESYCD